MNKLLQTALLAASFTTLISCGSGDDGETATAPQTTDPIAQGGDDVTDASRFGPAEFLTAECGSTEVSTLTANNLTPTPFFTNQVVEGRLLQGSPDLNSAFWEISLESGNYHLILDKADESNQFDSIGVSVVSIVGSDEETLIFGVDSEIDARSYLFLELETAQTLTLRLEPVFDAVTDYSMAIIPNGSAVPSPRLTLCPEITTISLGETQVVELPDRVNREDNRWYRINFPESGNYTIDAAITSEEVATLQYIPILFERFGDTDSETTISTGAVSGTLFEVSDEFTANRGDAWIRLHTTTGPHDVEFTVRQ